MITNILLLITIGILLWDRIPRKPKKSIIDEPRETNEAEENRKKQLQEEFDNLMGYSIKDAIESKKVNK